MEGEQRLQVRQQGLYWAIVSAAGVVVATYRTANEAIAATQGAVVQGQVLAAQAQQAIVVAQDAGQQIVAAGQQIQHKLTKWFPATESAKRLRKNPPTRRKRSGGKGFQISFVYEIKRNNFEDYGA